jgi:hypothetical protein
MPNDVIDRIRNLARQAHANLGLLFADRHGNPLFAAADDSDSNDDDKSYRPNNGKLIQWK